MSTSAPILTPAAIDELARALAATFAAAVETVAGPYRRLDDELGEIREELLALSNRIESHYQLRAAPSPGPSSGLEQILSSEPAAGWLIQGPFPDSPRFRVYERQTGGLLYRFAHDSYEGARAGVADLAGYADLDPRLGDADEHRPIPRILEPEERR